MSRNLLELAHITSFLKAESFRQNFLSSHKCSAFTAIIYLEPSGPNFSHL